MSSRGLALSSRPSAPAALAGWLLRLCRRSRPSLPSLGRRRAYLRVLLTALSTDRTGTCALQDYPALPGGKPPVGVFPSVPPGDFSPRRDSSSSARQGDTTPLSQHFSKTLAPKNDGFDHSSPFVTGVSRRFRVSLVGMAVVAYLHGVGGVRPGWSEALAGHLDDEGLSARIVAPSYAALLLDDPDLDESDSDVEPRGVDGPTGSPPGAPPSVASDHPDLVRAYRRRQERLAETLLRCEDVVPVGLSWPAVLPRPSRIPMAEFLSSPLGGLAGLDQARRYLEQPRRRERVVAKVGAEILAARSDAQESVIVIGHSLGAVVALDVLDSLDLDVDLLITMGAPLGHVDISGRLVDRGVRVSRLGNWVNVVHLGDPVVLGRGARDMFPAALDVFLPLLAGGGGLPGLIRNMARIVTAHLDSTYLQSHVVRTAVATTLARSAEDVTA